MLQRGLSNRPTGAVAFLLLGAAYALNFARTHDHQNLTSQSLLGKHVVDALVLVQRTGAAIDHTLLSWGEILETESQNLGCLKKERLIAVGTKAMKTLVCDSSYFIFCREANEGTTPCPAICPKPSM